MTKEVEHILLTKKFFELDQEEKLLIREFAETELDFDQLKFVLTQVRELRNIEKMYVDKSVKVNLDNLFDKTYAHKRLAWYNKLWLFLWPEETRFYARPLVQFATMVVLILTVVTFTPFNKNRQLAMNESKEVVFKEQAAQKLTDEISKNEENQVDSDDLITADVKAAKEEVESIGWALSDTEVILASDAIVDERSEHVSPSPSLSTNAEIVEVESFFSGASVYGESRDDMVLSRSVTTTQPKTFSPKDKPELFDVLTALY